MTASLMERGFPQVPKDWTDAEVKFAANLHRMGHDAAAIALALPNRTANAIEAKLQRSGLWRWRVTKDTFLLDLRGKLRPR